MRNFSQLLTDAINSPFAQFLLDAAAKATVLLAAAIVATSLFRRSSAAVRHRIWCLTFAALVLLPALSAALPEWRIAVLPQRSPLAYTSPLAPREESSVTLGVQTESAVADETHLPIARGLTANALPLAEREDYYTPAINLVVEHTTPSSVGALAGRPIDVATLWLAGTLIALTPLIIGFARTLLVRRQSHAIDDALWTNPS